MAGGITSSPYAACGRAPAQSWRACTPPPLLVLLLLGALFGPCCAVTTSSSETNDAAAAAPAVAALGVCGVRAPASSLAVSAADASIAGTYDVTVRALHACLAGRRCARCTPCWSACDPTPSGLSPQSCRAGRPVYTRRAATPTDPPRVLCWVPAGNASASTWRLAASLSAADIVSPLLTRCAHFSLPCSLACF